MKPTAIVALDLATAADAAALVDRLGESCGFYKVGSELFTAAGPAIVEFLRARGKEVFLDLKLHDIPNTVGRASAVAARLGARLITVHASGGSAMVRAAVEGAGDGAGSGGGRCGVLAVSVLTSLDASQLGAVWGRKSLSTEREVVRLAELAASAGAAGIVCSGHELAAVRRRFGDRLVLLVAGVRARGEASADQARTITPVAAARLGADYVVLGRVVTAARDPRAALGKILGTLAAAAGTGD